MEKSAFLVSLDSNLANKLSSLKLSSVIVDSFGLNEQLVSTIKSELPNTRIKTSLNIFAGKDLYEKFGSAIPLEASERDVIKDWYYGLCPTSEEVREVRLNQIEALIKNLNVDGVLLNFLHYPTYWLSDEPDIFDTCYCKRCIAKFSEYLHGEPLPANLNELVEAIDGQYYIEWLEFKSEVISSFLKEVRGLVARSGREFEISVSLVPWNEKEFGSALTRILGIDVSKIAAHADCLCPMLYYKLLGKDVNWIKDTLDYYSSFKVRVVPIAFMANELASIDESEFDNVLEVVTSEPSKGIIISELSVILGDSQKIAKIGKI